MKLPLATRPVGSSAEVRARILEQHETLRHLIKSAVVIANEAAAGEAACEGLLPYTIDELTRHLVNHLAFEESLILPLLSQAHDMSRAQALLDEHGRQRQKMQTLLELSRDVHDPQGLALMLQTLSSDILIDMGEEERHLLTDLVALCPPEASTSG